MPKGYKSQHGYATNKVFEGGQDYRTIAETMTAAGSKMNHATARNVFISALCKIAKPIHSMHGAPNNDASVQRTAKDPRFQSGIAEIISTLKDL